MSETSALHVRLLSTGQTGGMTVYVAWTSADLGDLHPATDLVGPWREVVVAAPGLGLVDSPGTLSAVYRALKWSLPDGVALTVAPVAELPKATGFGHEQLAARTAQVTVSTGAHVTSRRTPGDPSSNPRSPGFHRARRAS